MPAVAAPVPRRFGRRGAFVIALAATLSQLLLFGGVYSWTWVPAQIFLLTGLAVILVGASWRGQRLPWHPLLFPVLGFGVLVVVQWAGHFSVYPALTLTGMLQLSAGGAAFYLALYAFRSAKNLRYLSTGLWVFTGFVAAEAIVQFFEANGRIYWFKYVQYSTAVGPFVYHNFYAGAMDLLIPVCIAAAFWPLSGKPLDWLARVRRGVFPALALVSLIVSYSRGGFFTLLFEGLVGIIVFWKQIRGMRGGFTKLVLVLLCFLALVSLTQWKPLLSRLGKLEQHNASAIDRIKVSEACLRIWRDHPWLGSGFGTFPAIYPAYETFDNGLQWVHAHDEWAQALAETGSVGGILILAFAVLLFQACWPRGKGRLSPTQIYERACAIGLAGFLFHSSGDFLFHAPGLMLLFFLLAGAAVSAGMLKPTRAQPVSSTGSRLELAHATTLRRRPSA